MLPIIILCTILSLAIADLPIHCLRSQILGRWKWELTRSFKDSHLSCGHPSHDSNLDELTNSDKYDFVSEDTLNLALSYPDRVTNLDNGDTGFFTMVFDEALEIRIGGQIIFAKFKYRLKDSDRDYVPPVTDLQSYESFCGETGTGWYHDESNENWGCARGLQYQSDHKQLLKPERSLLIRKTNFYNAESHVTTYEPDLKLIKSINSNPKSLWKAGVNEVFVGKSLFNIGHMLGRRRYHKPALFRSSKRIAREQDISVPESVDWRNVDSPIRNQGQCGSCYVFSTLAMLETRIRIAYPEKQFDDLHFSEQDVLACSRYNEGCEGGYPYLVAKYAHEFGAIGYDENRYIGYDSECPVRSRNDFNRRTRSSLSYRYVGGYFGACNEGAMMNEIALHGPIVTAIQAPSSLMVYKSGIFNDCPRVVKNDDGYEQSDHAVVIVGYGEEKGVKYWIIRNSWGEEYGEQGYFRLLRGVDACGVESAAVVTYV